MPKGSEPRRACENDGKVVDFHMGTIANLFGMLIFGTIGFGAFLWGKRRTELPPLVLGDGDVGDVLDWAGAHGGLVRVAGGVSSGQVLRYAASLPAFRWSGGGARVPSRSQGVVGWPRAQRKRF